MAVTTAMAGAFALRYDASAIAALGLLGGYATPVLLSTGQDRPWVLFSWVLLLNIGALAAARLRKWRSLEASRLRRPCFSTGHGYLDFVLKKQTVAELFALVYYGLFVVSEEPQYSICLQILVAMAMPVVWDRMTLPYALNSLLLASAGLALADWRKRDAGISVTFGAFWVAYAAWASDYRPKCPGFRHSYS